MVVGGDRVGGVEGLFFNLGEGITKHHYVLFSKGFSHVGVVMGGKQLVTQRITL